MLAFAKVDGHRWGWFSFHF